MKTTRSILVLLFVLLTAQVASAFYCPSTGRWLSRDPIGETGFEVLRATTARPRVASIGTPPTARWIYRDANAEIKEPNRYDFVDNDAVNGWDLFGLAIAGTPADNDPADTPDDPANPANNASRQQREQFARDIMNQFQVWRNANKCCNLDLCTLVSQWMYESNWGRSAAARGKNLGGITGKGPNGSTGNFRKYDGFSEFYDDYKKLICNASRYRNAIGKKGQTYVDALKAAGYDATDPNYANNVMQIYRQLGCK